MVAKYSKILLFVLTLLFLFNVNAETVTQYSHGYDEYTGVCSNDSFYYILEDNYGTQGYGQFSHTYDAHFVKIRADINYQLVPNTTYELTFSNPIHDYNSGPNQYGWTAITTSSVSINIENGCGGTIMRPVVVTDVTYPNSTAYDRDLVVITFTTSDYVAKPWFSVTLQSGYVDNGIYQITTGNKARLDNIYLTIKNDTGDTGDATNQDVINNDKQNTQDIINNQNNNTQDIINNQNQNTQQQIESQQVCTVIDKNSIDIDNSYLLSFGGTQTNNDFGITRYFPISSSSILTRSVTTTNNAYMCFYNVNKDLISCVSNNNAPLTNIDIPNNSSFVRFTINKTNNRPQFKLCTNGNQALENTLTDDNIDSDTGTNFFNNFSTTDNGGISAIVTKPLILVNSLLDNNNSCANLLLPSFMGADNVTLPSGCILWNSAPALVVNLWNIFITGFGSYYVLKQLFLLVENLKSPNNDKVEVLDL